MAIANKVFIVAVEPSGDQLGAYLIESLNKLGESKLDIKGVGGAKMADLGVQSAIDLSPLAVLGLVDGLKVYPKIKDLIRNTVQQVIDHNPKIVVLIDSWGFTIRVAKRLKKLLPDVILVKYVGPQVFATRPGRARTTAAAYDHLLTIHSFDRHFFEDEGLNTTFVGNPALFSDADETSTKTSFAKYNPDNKTVLSVFFGSRANEIKQLSDIMLSALEVVKSGNPNLLLVAPLSDNIATLVRSMAIDDHRLQGIILLDETTKSEVFANSDLALACSGTITLELAQTGVPTVVVYKIGGWVGVILQKLFFKARFASLINLSADEEIFPEFINYNCTAQKVADSLNGLLQKPQERKGIKEKLAKAVAKMRGKSGNPSQIAAKKIISLLDQRLDKDT